MISKPKDNSTFKIKIRGLRGSYPVCGEEFLKFGGNTTCYEIWADNCLIIIDAGTGIISLGHDLIKAQADQGPDSRKNIESMMLFTHTHLDHIMGLPFFVPIFQGDTILYVYGPDSSKYKFEDALNFVLNPPLFPITVDDMDALKLFRNISQVESIYWGSNKGIPLVLNNYREHDRIEDACKRYPIHVSCMKSYAHTADGVMIYRISFNNKEIVIATDVEGYVGGDTRLINFAKGADLLIHDAGYTKEIYTSLETCKQGYGHSTMEMAVDVGMRAEVKQLALVHHEPLNDDKFVLETEKKAQAIFPNTFAAFEGQEIIL